MTNKKQGPTRTPLKASMHLQAAYMTVSQENTNSVYHLYGLISELGKMHTKCLALSIRGVTQNVLKPVQRPATDAHT